MEKRISYSRNNVILLWDYAMEVLKGIGVKTVDKKFGIGSLHHVGIRRLQTSLLKIALMLGVEFHPGIVFRKVVPHGKSWAAEVLSFDGDVSDDDQENYHKENVPSPRNGFLFEVRGNVLLFDALIGADGLNSQVAQIANFERITMKAKPAIGVTFNFVNSRSPEENSLDEFGVSSYCDQEKFKNLQEKHSIQLENCVYYRDETHYFVCTVPKEILLELGVFKSDAGSYPELLSPENSDREKLAKFCRNIATHFGLPDKVPFEINHRGEKDIQVFDFTKKLASTEQVRFISQMGHPDLFVALVGDGLLEPFWPLGTGANRALLSSQDALFSLTEFLTGVPKDTLLQRSSKIHQQLKLVESPDIKLSKGNNDNNFLLGEEHYSEAGIDPQTRYRSLVY